MTRRGLHLLLSLLVGLLTIGEAYHYHPDGGERWQFVAIPPIPSPSAEEASGTNGNDPPAGGAACPLDLWASLLSTTIILLALLLLPPARGTRVADRAGARIASRTALLVSTRAPPLPA